MIFKDKSNSFYYRIIDLESYNAQLKERLNLVVRYVNSNKRSSSAATYRRTGSGLLRKTKMYKLFSSNVVFKLTNSILASKVRTNFYLIFRYLDRKHRIVEYYVLKMKLT